MSTAATEALTLTHVSRAFGALKAVEDVSLSVRPGERRAIIGPNGAGKTTLFNLISGELPVNSGHIVLFGRDITALPAYRRTAQGIGRTYQITNIFPALAVTENIMLAAQGLSRRKFALLGSLSAGGPVRERAKAALAASGLGAKAATPARELSYGEQRQLEIALALASNPRVLLLDEPAAGLSPAERPRVAQLIRALPPTLTIVLIEHDMDLALELVDTVTCLHFGRVVAEGDAAGIRHNPTVQEIYLGAADA